MQMIPPGWNPICLLSKMPAIRVIQFSIFDTVTAFRNEANFGAVQETKISTVPIATVVTSTATTSTIVGPTSDLDSAFYMSWARQTMIDKLFQPPIKAGTKSAPDGKDLGHDFSESLIY
jgi:hypothetical protein